MLPQFHITPRLPPPVTGRLAWFHQDDDDLVDQGAAGVGWGLHTYPAPVPPILLSGVPKGGHLPLGIAGRCRRALVPFHRRHRFVN